MSREAIRDLFARHRLRRTRQREAVYAALAANAAHPTAEEIHRQVKASGQPISLATVYNTLEALTDAGLCRRIAPTGKATGARRGGDHADESSGSDAVGRAREPGGGAGASFRYDADMSEHVHLITSDGDIMDVPSDLANLLVDNLPRGVLARIEARLGRRIGRVSVELQEERS